MKFSNFYKKQQMGTGAIPRFYDSRDRSYDEIAVGSAPITMSDWKNGFDVERKLNFELPIKNQNGSSSCTFQATSYYVGILNMIETGKYKEVSAKAGYSQIRLPAGGAYIMDAIKLCVDWGAVPEQVVPSYQNGKPPSEKFMIDLSWKNERVDKYAKVLQAKEYRKINARDNMDLFAMAIRDNNGVVGGVLIGNNSSWRTENPTPSTRENGHAVYYSAYGMDEKGKYIATINSWGKRPGFRLQKLRQDYFNKLYQFDPWVLCDKPNTFQATPNAQEILKANEKKIIIEGEGVGRKGIIVSGELKEIEKDRVSDACLYSFVNNGFGKTVSTELFDEMYNQDKEYVF